MERADLIRLMGVKNTLTEYERGRLNPKLMTMRAFADALDVPVAWLMGRGEVREPWEA